MTVLGIDIETYSDIDINANGVYKYVDSNNFKILLFAYAFDDEEVEIIDLENKEELPERVMKALLDKNVIKTAFNAQFERVALNKYFGIKTENWDCTMIKAWSLGITGGLENVGKVIGLDEDKQKLTIGKKLIKIFCNPKPDRKNKNQITMFKVAERVLPSDMPTEWEQFKEYCIRDVEVERNIRKKLERFETIDAEKKLYELDQKINDRGVLIDLDMAENAISIDLEQTNRLTELFIKATGMGNPNSLSELKKYIKEKTGKSVKSITKDNLEKLQEKFKNHEDIVTALDIRQRLSKTSISKYKKMIEVTCEDKRARGLLQFYGASTGRWAGRLIQVQNLPQNHIKDLDTARELVKNGDLELLEMMYDNPSDVLSQCIRPTIIPSPGKKFIVSDFSAIEARVIAWIAGEKWRLDVFNSHGKIYEASASQMFNVPIEEITKGSELRQKGKVAELALGYQGSVGALKQMKALEMGLSEEELQPLVDTWRAANPKIKQLWYNTENKVMEAIANRTTVQINKYIKAIYRSGILFIELPSGRRLAYPKPRLIDHDKFPGKKKIVFEGMNSTTKQWGWIDTYGGKLVENIIQAIARDCLAYSMLNLEKKGYEIVMHIHDEVVIEVEEKKDELKNITDLMGQEIPWAKGLPLRADGYECSYYQKD
ncbi:DNA polymerase [Tissierella praeacuta]|uniref:DNA polymerase n=1 Tax=Tissierella praeacuta TaxID=43131 RepID=UPI0028A1F281|nr:DNA polymerase [Tissierella praeacuta]